MSNVNLNPNTQSIDTNPTINTKQEIETKLTENVQSQRVQQYEYGELEHSEAEPLSPEQQKLKTQAHQKQIDEIAQLKELSRARMAEMTSRI